MTGSLQKRDTHEKGFTLIELLVVIAILGILASIVLSNIQMAQEAAYMAKAQKELKSIHDALILYYNDHGEYPEDDDRNVPPGLEEYLAPGIWPEAAWPGSELDWENWPVNKLTDDPKEQVYQISIRFCPIEEPDNCQFPDRDWAADFDYHSSVYYCIEGPCRAHSSKPLEHPGYCINCNDEDDE